MDKICIHIQTHLPHFKYTDKLINSFLKLTNIKELKIPIFIIIDNDELINNFKMNYSYDYDQPISYFIQGCEQSPYEYYIYSLYLKNPDDINLITIDGDLHSNNLFRKVINSNIDLDVFCLNINEKYFNYIQSFRGDYYRACLTNNRGKYLIQKLNINIAVSNYTGN